MVVPLLISYKRLTGLGGVILMTCFAVGCGDKGDAKLPMGLVDVPQSGQTVVGHLDAVGWAVSEDRVTDVSVYVDRTFWRKCKIGGSRPDVGKAYPGFPEGDNAGWMVDLDSASLPEGKHELEFQARSSKGAVRDIGTVNVVISH